MGDELEPLRAVRAFVDARLLPALETPGDAMRAAVAVAHFARATSTVDAIIVLAERGLGSQALMLDRALFELMVNAWWSRLDVNAAEDLFVGFSQLDWQLRREKARSYPWLLGEPEDAEELSEEHHSRLVGVFGSFGRKGWTGKTLRMRIADLEEAGRGPGTQDLMAFYDVVTYLSNQELHGSSWSLARLVRRVPAGRGVQRVQMRTGPEDELVDLAVRCAFWIYAQLVELLVREFDVPVGDELAEVNARAAHAFGLEAESAPSEQ